MNKNNKRKAHNILLYSTTVIIATLFLIAMSHLAYGRWGWFAVFCITFAWLSFVWWANNVKKEEEQ